MSITATDIKKCKKCESTDIGWQTFYTSTGGVPDGRLRLSEVQCQFVLGCNFCSETLLVLSGDRVAEILTNSLKY
jgi:hypothetical protein